MKIETIKKLYKEIYPFEDFYSLLQVSLNKNSIIPKVSLLKSLKTNKTGQIVATSGDVRVDLPVWFGDLNSDKRVLFLGLEPRDSNDKYNTEKIEKYIFGTPFGVEFWNEKNKYYKSFKSTLNKKDLFVYFTDVVKHYEVKRIKKDSNKNARYNFWNKAALKENIDFLNKEFEIIKPTHIIALGGDSHKFLQLHFGRKWNINKVTHPPAHPQNGINAFEIASNTLKELLH